jgi:hypothetical protein
LSFDFLALTEKARDAIKTKWSMGIFGFTKIVNPGVTMVPIAL